MKGRYFLPGQKNTRFFPQIFPYQKIKDAFQKIQGSQILSDPVNCAWKEKENEPNNWFHFEMYELCEGGAALDKQAAESRNASGDKKILAAVFAHHTGDRLLYHV